LEAYVVTEIVARASSLFGHEEILAVERAYGSPVRGRSGCRSTSLGRGGRLKPRSASELREGTDFPFPDATDPEADGMMGIGQETLRDRRTGGDEPLAFFELLNRNLASVGQKKVLHLPDVGSELLEEQDLKLVR